MKAIMISDKPKWCALMMNGDKNIEVRTSKALAKAIQKLIDEQGFADIYVHCSKAKHIKDYLQIENGKYVCDVPKDYESELNGKVVFKFRCCKVEEIPSRQFSVYHFPYTETLDDYELLSKSCLTTEELDEYLGYDKTGYALHIDNLVIFDKPKELQEFNCSITNVYINDKKVMRQNTQLTKAPQNFCYVEV